MIEETLNEAVERLDKNKNLVFSEVYRGKEDYQNKKNSFLYKEGVIAGAKWQSERMYSKEELFNIILMSCEEGMNIQRTINDKVSIPATRIKNFQNKVIDNYRK